MTNMIDFFLLIHSLIQYKRDKLNIISFCLKLLIFSQFVKKNPELINPAFQTQKLKIEDFMVEEFMVEEFMIKEFMVEGIHTIIAVSVHPSLLNS